MLSQDIVRLRGLSLRPAVVVGLAADVVGIAGSGGGGGAAGVVGSSVPQPESLDDVLRLSCNCCCWSSCCDKGCCDLVDMTEPSSRYVDASDDVSSNSRNSCRRSSRALRSVSLMTKSSHS